MQQALLWLDMVVEWCLGGGGILLGVSGGFNGFGRRRSGLRMDLCMMKMK